MKLKIRPSWDQFLLKNGIINADVKSRHLFYRTSNKIVLEMPIFAGVEYEGIRYVFSFEKKLKKYIRSKGQKLL